ncbi:hypothetical protein [Pyrobaculum aerophilum]|uniref:Uncharacterized protein n=1 Tax=Pyrobaculum aerophilum TaxID=13773 RepID=A0A371QY70_9CREN|nr:hypothetical protein [Pyrobaculum aerophilum]RFA95567.1 hypothetical protein CGL52_12730 [Pyrobaculum aerophilum]RFA98275.1 hypothetical protein CGL51_00920 [Pyrobaculum aerophilum]
MWFWIGGFVSKGLSPASGVGGELLKIEGGYVRPVDGAVKVFLWVRNLGGEASLPRTVYVFKEGSSSPVCIANGLPWSVEPRGLEYLDLWMPVGWELAIGDTSLYCSEGVVPGATYVIKVVTARGLEYSSVFTAG